MTKVPPKRSSFWGIQAGYPEILPFSFPPTPTLSPDGRYFLPTSSVNILHLPLDVALGACPSWSGWPLLTRGLAERQTLQQPALGLHTRFPTAHRQPLPPRHGQPAPLRPEPSVTLGGTRASWEAEQLNSSLTPSHPSGRSGFPEECWGRVPQSPSGPTLGSDTGWEDTVALSCLTG